MSWQDYISYFPELLHGFGLTLILTAGGLIGSLLISLFFCACLLTNKKWLTLPIKAYIFFIRGTPFLVQIFLIYYGSSQFEWLRDSALWVIFKPAVNCSIIALALNSAAYSTELLLGAIRSIPKGELEAIQAYGLSAKKSLFHFILPRAFRIALPAYSNEVIMIVKASSLASTITLLELMGITQQLINQTYAALPLLLTAGIIYLILNSLFFGLFKILESHYHRYLNL